MSTTATTSAVTSASNSAAGMNVVSEQIFEFLLTEMSVYAARSCIIVSNNTGSAISQQQQASTSDNNNNNNMDDNATMSTPGYGNASTGATTNTNMTDEESMTVSAEMAAAKLERMGYSVGYRITERLAQNKTWNSGSSTGTAATSPPASSATTGNNNDNKMTMMSEAATATATAAQQLEAVKFLCKEVWMEIFRKQIDKLQTNHRGVFVLKDLELKWLTRFPVGTEHARVSAIRLLAFPCGIVRGALANLGIPSVVSCDFLADGQKMAACSFNIKVK